MHPVKWGKNCQLRTHLRRGRDGNECGSTSIHGNRGETWSKTADIDCPRCMKSRAYKDLLDYRLMLEKTP